MRHLSDKDESAASRVIGVFGCLKLVLPHLKPSDDDDASLDARVETYELCLRLTTWQSNHNVVNAALESLNQLLESSSDDLVGVLLSPGGLLSSRIVAARAARQREARRSADSPKPSQGEQGVFATLESALTDANPEVDKWIDDSEHVLTMMKNPSTRSESPQVCGAKGNTFPSLSDVVAEVEEEEEEEEEVTEERWDKGSIASSELLEDPCLGEEDRDWDSRSMPSPLSSKFSTRRNLDIGTCNDADVPLKYCARHLLSSFLLAGFPGQTIPDKLTRVSVKSLVLACLGHVFRLYPRAIFLTLAKQDDEDARQMTADVLLFAQHPDPQIRGHAAMLAGWLLKGLVRSESGDKQLFETLTQLIIKVQRGTSQPAKSYETLVAWMP